MTLTKGTDIVAMAILPPGIVPDGSDDEDAAGTDPEGLSGVVDAHEADYEAQAALDIGEVADASGADGGSGPAAAGPHLLLVTQQGLGKRMSISEIRLRSGRTGVGIRAMQLNQGDRLAAVQVVGEPLGDGKHAGDAAADVLLSTQQGQLVRVPVADINMHSRMAKGHRLVKVREGDEVVAATVILL